MIYIILLDKSQPLADTVMDLTKARKVQKKMSANFPTHTYTIYRLEEIKNE